MKEKINLLILFLLISFLISCTSAKITIEEAKSIAIDFVKENVIFHSENKTVLNPLISIVNKQKTKDFFIFNIIITTTQENKNKSAKITIEVSRDGRVISFNGQPVSSSPYQKNV